ncbi:cell division protein FtsQ/DivIB [Candidatus Hepatobacter penaei]|uniref:cell division protein FtsQ/DivIB n=1 Tax=Candidatus Hepatobacter penaei TaxID=1274402 RepID=UPI0009E21E0A|nr:FtsQ-type POTRA domain-containing protein [Candidatus Hepatobacter penaei]
MPIAASLCPLLVARLWGAGCVACLLGALCFLCGRFWVDQLSQGAGHVASHHFVIKMLDIKGLGYTSKQDVLRAGGVRLGQDLWSVDLAQVRENIARLPWVAAVDVKRTFPEKIMIHVQERVPFALWQRRSALHLLDTQGRVIHAPLPVGQSFVLLVGKEAPRHGFAFWQSLQRADPALAKKVHVLHHLPSGRWDVHLKDGLILRLPHGSLTKALTRLRRLARKMPLEKAASIDLRIEDRVMVTPFVPSSPERSS